MFGRTDHVRLHHSKLRLQGNVEEEKKKNSLVLSSYTFNWIVQLEGTHKNQVQLPDHYKGNQS